VTLHRRATRLLALLLVGVGVALLARTAQLGGGQVGYLAGALFVAAGLGRLYLSR
jgi:hypothetical protein